MRLLVPLLFVPLVACRQIAELPPEAPSAPAPSASASAGDARPPAWLASEAAVFEHAQKVLEEAGCPEVRTAVVRISDEVPLPSYRARDRTLLVPPFRDGQGRMRERIARLSATRFAGALTFVDSFGSAAAAYEAYGVLSTVAVAHELWHHVQFVRGAQGTPRPLDVYDLEAEAIEVEQAFLAHLVEARQVSARWRTHYRQAVLAIRDSIPQRALDAVPEDASALRQQFARAYALYGLEEAEGRGVNVQLSAASTVYAGYTQRRLTLLSKGARPLKELVSRPSPPPK
jgi:hypothetical protein